MDISDYVMTLYNEKDKQLDINLLITEDLAKRGVLETTKKAFLLGEYPIIDMVFYGLKEYVENNDSEIDRITINVKFDLESEESKNKAKNVVDLLSNKNTAKNLTWYQLKKNAHFYYSGRLKEIEDNLNTIKTNELIEDVKAMGYFGALAVVSIAFGSYLNEIGLLDLGFYLIAAGLLVPKIAEKAEKSGELYDLRIEKEDDYRILGELEKKLDEILDKAEIKYNFYF